ncbi:unnamed protein product [Caenorhabditis nigoni]
MEEPVENPGFVIRSSSDLNREMDYCNNPDAVRNTVERTPRIPIEQIIIPFLTWMCFLAGFTLDPIFFHFGSILPPFLYIIPKIAPKINKFAPKIGKMFYILSHCILLLLIFILQTLIAFNEVLIVILTHYSNFLKAIIAVLESYVDQQEANV